MEADISIWQGTGHFYFALTQLCGICHSKMRMSRVIQSRRRGRIGAIGLELNEPDRPNALHEREQRHVK